MCSSLSGFLPLSLHLSSSLSSPCPPSRTVYYRPHHDSHCSSSVSSSLPPNRVLYVIGVPVLFNENDLIQLFNIFGSIESIILINDNELLIAKHKSFKYDQNNDSNPFQCESPCRSALIVYCDESAIKLSSSFPFLPSSSIIQPSIDGGKARGIKKWNDQYRLSHPSINRLSSQVNQYMSLFDNRKEEEKKRRREGEQGEGEGDKDDDGFILVKRRKINLLQLNEEKRIIKEKEENKEKKAKSKQLIHFYRFQDREEKQRKLEELKKRWEQDKKSIAKMKAERKFKPQ